MAEFPSSLTLNDILRVEVGGVVADGEGIRMCLTGGRDFDDLGFVWSNLDVIHHFDTIREIGFGCAEGVDALALSWAKTNGVPWKRYVADWDAKGKAGGSIRNIVMLEDFKPELLGVYPGGVGTTHCARSARKMKIKREFFVPDDRTDPLAEAARWG